MWHRALVVPSLAIGSPLPQSSGTQLIHWAATRTLHARRLVPRKDYVPRQGGGRRVGAAGLVVGGSSPSRDSLDGRRKGKVWEKEGERNKGGMVERWEAWSPRSIEDLAPQGVDATQQQNKGQAFHSRCKFRCDAVTALIRRISRPAPLSRKLARGCAGACGARSVVRGSVAGARARPLGAHGVCGGCCGARGCSFVLTEN
jgi:hypothetical protein